MVNGARIANHQASAHVKNGQVTFFSSSFGTAQHFSKSDLAVSAAKATVDFEKASATASAQLGIPVYSDFKHILEYVEQPDGKIVYAYKLQLRDNPATKWVQFNSTEQPYDDANVVAAAVNLFYLNNLMHDITYQYGFTESAGNFQKNNFGKGGKEGDAVTINVINAFGVDNANFVVGADGQPGVMNMYRFTRTDPNRNPGLDNGVCTPRIWTWCL
ncbi:extracellular metalloproteinase 9 [Batrachochytrium salamandrivorans]|nr:extracellular metalloproteinase 9 [Batrachochytrium salamandrivorans]